MGDLERVAGENNRGIFVTGKKEREYNGSIRNLQV